MPAQKILVKSLLQDSSPAIIGQMATLTQIEQEAAVKIRRQIKLVPSKVSPIKTGLMAFIITPIIFMEALFIPVLGWGVILIVLLSTGLFLYYERSIKLTISWFLGACGGFAAFTNIAYLMLKTSAGIPLYIMVFIATLSLLAYSISLGFAVVKRVRALEASLSR